MLRRRLMKAGNSIDGHEYVEIAGVKWATMNVGANSITDTGLYFQWGDTQGYTASQCGRGAGQKYFDWEDYKWGADSTDMTKYSSYDGKKVLDLSDDAARANWGGSWRMPTINDYYALGNAVTTAWTTNYQGSGVAGIICTDKTDSSKVLFFPACGFCGSGSRRAVGSESYHWSSSISGSSDRRALISYFTNSNVYWSYTHLRCDGLPVRPVIG